MVTIEAVGRYGDSVSASLCPVTSYIVVTMPDSNPFLVDPEDQDGMAWLKKVFGSQLDILLERRDRHGRKEQPGIEGTIHS